jgi:hypothetical protein
MYSKTFCLLLLFFFIGCNSHQQTVSIKRNDETIPSFNSSIHSVKDIPLPANFERIKTDSLSFEDWLRNFSLRKNNTVYLYNKQPKADQTLHYAVLNISTGDKDLQQCADAIMRLKAEYYFQLHQYNKINFISGNKTYNFAEWLRRIDSNKDEHELLLEFMQTVFMYCGTYTVDEMTKSINMSEMKIGDVFVKAGAPGHAMIVMDMAENKTTHQRIFMLAQSYMPAQDMHIVINPNNEQISPWYEVSNQQKIITPSWVFDKSQLKRWK